MSETLIQWDIHHLLPCGTVVVADPPPAGESVLRPRAWDTDGIPTLAFDPFPGDPPPSATRIDQVVGFLADHGVEVGLIQYLDFADRWFDHLAEQGMGVWIRGHGVDLSARLTEARWRQAYRRYADAAGIIVPSRVAARSLTMPGCRRQRFTWSGTPWTCRCRALPPTVWSGAPPSVGWCRRRRPFCW